MFTLSIQDANGQVVNTVSFEQGTFTLGRMDSCEIMLPSSSVSRQHARLTVHNGRCYIEDLGSANGIIVDGQRVVGRRDLGTASQIRIGDYYLFLEYKRPGLSDEQRVLQTVFIPRDADHFKLVRVYDSFAGEEFILSEADNSIGRTDENFILLSDPSISRYHAKIVREEEAYTVMDLGSSNGTSVNGKKLDAPRTLMSRDQVKFGNVCFVFLESDQSIDLRNYVGAPPQQGSNFVRIAVAAILLLCGVAIGGSIFYSLVNMKRGDGDAGNTTPIAQPAETLEDRINETLARAQRSFDRGDWGSAISVAEEVVELDPTNEAAMELEAQARLELDAEAQLERAEELLEKGEYEQARAELQKTPEGTRAYDRAQTTLSHVERTLAHNYKNEAIRLEKEGKRSLNKAHDKFVEALELTPDDEDALTRIRALEKKMKKQRRRFRPYRAPAE